MPTTLSFGALLPLHRLDVLQNSLRPEVLVWPCRYKDLASSGDVPISCSAKGKVGIKSRYWLTTLDEERALQETCRQSVYAQTIRATTDLSMNYIIRCLSS